MTNYEKFRGKCKEYCLELIKNDPSLTLVRGWYHCAIYGKQSHWWCVNSLGEIVDPTINQFPDKNGEYEEFSGVFECSQCGKDIKEEELNTNGAQAVGNYIFCSGECYCRCVLG